MKMIEKLDMLMAERKINRSELARNAGIPYTTIVGLYEKGCENVKLSTLRKLSNYLDCSIDYLSDDNISRGRRFNSSHPDHENTIREPKSGSLIFCRLCACYLRVTCSVNTPPAFSMPPAAIR